jgi:hypothetical protein
MRDHHGRSFVIPGSILKKRLWLVGLCLLTVSSGDAPRPLGAQDTAGKPNQLDENNLLAAMHSISAFPLYDYIKELSSEKYDGRLTGTPGFNKAAQWAAEQFKRWNLKPAGDKGTFLQSFPNPYTLVLPGDELSLQIPQANGEKITKSYRFEDDYVPGSTSDSGAVTAEVVFVGYGITAPELNYDEYKDVDVNGKIVLVEPEVPVVPDREADEFTRWRAYSFPSYKVKNAKTHGAAGVIYDDPIPHPECGFVKELLLTNAGPSVANDIFAGTGKKHDAILERIQTTRQPASFATGKTMTIANTTEHHPEGIGANIIGYLEGKDSALKNEAIIIGGHLDGLGRNPMFMPGANDDSSAVAVTLGIAEALAKSAIPLKRSVLFVLFGAEEQGVKGSEYYVTHPFIPNEKVTGFINLERVGRGDQINGAGGSNFPPLWEFFDRSNHRYIHRLVRPGFATNLVRPGQDAAPFMGVNVPTISFSASGGTRLPYSTFHTTHDTIDNITPDIMVDLARLIFLSIVEMANNR